MIGKKRIEVRSNIPKYSRAVEKNLESALNQMASDIEMLAKVQKVPVDQGHLQGSIENKREGRLKRKVEASAKYARFQEFGGDGKRRVRRYSKPGTGAHYMRDSAKDIDRRKNQYIARNIRLVYVPGDGRVIWRSG